MIHSEFVQAYRSGTVRVNVDRSAAARFVSARLLLPLVMLPVLGAGVALALWGSLWTGFALIGAGTLAPVLIKRSAHQFVMTQVLQDSQFYEDAVNAGVLSIEE